MNYLFIHQSMPSQFVHLAPALAARPGNRVVFLTRGAAAPPAGVERVTYRTTRLSRESTHHYVRLFENAVLHGQQVLRECQALRQGGFTPDLIIGHPGWGETLFVKDIFPTVPLLNYCEFYYHGRGADIGFSPDQPTSLDAVCRARARNAHLLLSLEACDRGISPMHWQRAVHPAPLREKIAVVFDGIDTDIVRPRAAAGFALPGGRRLGPGDEVVTYVARNLEPYRGFPQFMRALPAILRARPDAQVVVAGGDGVSYGRGPEGGGTWRARMLAETGPFDAARVHMLGRLPYRDYLALLAVSTVHVYLTVPFVLSWSCLEAMAAGCLVVGSATPPVREVVRDGENGLLAPFNDPAAIAARVVEAIERREALTRLRAAARETVLERYALARCLPAQLRLVDAMAGR